MFLSWSRVFWRGSTKNSNSIGATFKVYNKDDLINETADEIKKGKP